LLTDDIPHIEEKAPKECPLGFTWKQMEAKITPAIDYALKLRRERELKAEKKRLAPYPCRYRCFTPNNILTYAECQFNKGNTHPYTWLQCGPDCKERQQ
jgi:hypothetical protein